MKNEIIIKKNNFTRKEKTIDLFFVKRAEKIVLTGKKKEAGKERIFVDVTADNLSFEKFKTDELNISIESYNKTWGVINFRDVDVETIEIFQENQREKFKVKGENIKNKKEDLSLRIVTLKGNIKDLDLKNFDKLRFYIGHEKTRKLSFKRGKYLEILSTLSRELKVEELRFDDIEYVNMDDLIIESGKFNVTKVKGLVTCISQIENLNEKSKISVEILVLNRVYKTEDFEILSEKYKKECVKAKILRIVNDYFERTEKVNFDFKRLMEKDLSLSEVLKIENIEMRRVVLNFLGGVRKLLEKEENKVLIEKTGRGELWAVGDAQNPEKCVKFLKYKDTSTDREYLSFVPPEINSVREGFAWKFQIQKDEYDEILSES